MGISISTTGDTDTGKPKEPSIYLSILINSIYPRIHSPRSRDPRFEKFSRCFYVSSATRSSLYLGFLYCFIIGLACFHSHSKSQHTRFSGAGSLLFYFSPCGRFGWERSMIPEDWAQVRGIWYGCWSLLV